MNDLVIVPKKEHVLWGKELIARIGNIAQSITAQNIASVLGQRVLEHAEKHEESRSSEIVLWARSDGPYTAAWSSARDRDQIIGLATWEAGEGLVAEIFSTPSSRFVEEPLLNAGQLSNLSQLRSHDVVSMQGLPVCIYSQCIGVLTRVHYEAKALPGAADTELSALAFIFEREAELTLLKMCLGMNLGV